MYNQVTFPLSCFPNKIKDIVLETIRHLGFNQDYISTAILVAFATACGKTHKIVIKNTWEEFPCLYVCLLGRPGANKSHPLSWAIKPLLKATERMLDRQPLSEEEMLGFEDPALDGGQLVLNNLTPEAIIKVMSSQNVRLIIWSDEISHLFRNINRYGNGKSSDVEMFLSIWSKQNIIVNRKTQETILIKQPYASVAGTTQPDVLQSLFKKSESNGLFDRFLFAYPESTDKAKMITDDLPQSVVEEYNSYLEKVLGLSMSIDGESTIIKFDEEAETEATDWYNRNADLINEEHDDRKRGIYTKLDTYFYRFCLILQMMSWSCGEESKDVVSLKTVKAAQNLVEFFRTNSLDVLRMLSPDPYDTLTDLQKKVLNSLTLEFSTGTGIQKAVSQGMSERNFKYFLHKKEVFKKLKTGLYKRLL